MTLLGTTFQLLIDTIANQSNTWPQLKSLRPSEVQTDHQNGEERWFKWLRTWHGFWCQMGWCEYFRYCWSTGIFAHSCVRTYSLSINSLDKKALLVIRNSLGSSTMLSLPYRQQVTGYLKDCWCQTAHLRGKNMQWQEIGAWKGIWKCMLHVWHLDNNNSPIRLRMSPF